MNNTKKKKIKYKKEIKNKNDEKRGRKWEHEENKDDGK